MSVVKKGKASWKPAGITDVINKEDGFRYRHCLKDADNLAKKKAEGWEVVSGLQSDKSTLTEKDLEGKSLASTYERRDTILCRLPEEIALERDAYHNNLTARSEQVLTAHIKKDLEKEGAASHGKITISSRKGTTTME